LTVLGAVFPHFCPNECKIWHGRADQSRPCGAKKTIFGPLGKNNTGMDALRVGLPVMTRGKTTTATMKTFVRPKMSAS